MSAEHYSHEDLARMTSAAHKTHDDYMSLMQAYMELKRECAALLRPLVERAEHVDSQTLSLLSDDTQVYVELGTCRRAATLLATLKEGTK